MTATKYKPGDRVVALRWPRGGAGVMVKPAPVHSLVRWDGQDEDKRVRIDDIRPETPEDVAKRAHEHCMSKWRATEPKHAHAIVHPGWGGVEGRVEVCVKTPAEMRQAADELRALADWFEKRPKEKP